MTTITISLSNSEALLLDGAITRHTESLEARTDLLLREGRKTDAGALAREGLILHGLRERITSEAKRHFIGW